MFEAWQSAGHWKLHPWLPGFFFLRDKHVRPTCSVECLCYAWQQLCSHGGSNEWVIAHAAVSICSGLLISQEVVCELLVSGSDFWGHLLNCRDGFVIETVCFSSCSPTPPQLRLSHLEDFTHPQRFPKVHCGSLTNSIRAVFHVSSRRSAQFWTS